MRERNSGNISKEAANLARGVKLTDAEFAPFLATWAKKISISLEDGLKARGKLEARILKSVGKVLAKAGGRKALTLTGVFALIANACAPIFERYEPTPPNPEPSPTANQLASGTEVAPPLAQEIERPISGVSILEQEDLLQNFPDVRDEFEKFEMESIAEFGGILPNNVELTAQGIITQYSDGDGDTLHPLFSIESVNPEVSTQVNLLLGLPEDDGSITYKLMPLERGEWTDASGRVWITLSVMNNTRGGEPLEDPAEMFATPEDELLSNPDTAQSFWSPTGNALDAARARQTKVLAALAASTPIPEPTPVPTPTEVAQELPADLETYEGEVQLWINPEFAWPSSVQLSENAADIFLTEICRGVSEGQFKNQFNGDEETCREYLIDHNGKFPEALTLPTKNQGYPDFDIISYRGFNIDLKKPIELRFFSEENQPDNLSEYIGYQGDFLRGFNLSLAVDGHLVISQYYPPSIKPDFAEAWSELYNWTLWAIFERLLPRSDFASKSIVAWRQEYRGDLSSTFARNVRKIIVPSD